MKPSVVLSLILGAIASLIAGAVFYCHFLIAAG
jgi:hypothetical protein